MPKTNLGRWSVGFFIGFLIFFFLPNVKIPLVNSVIPSIFALATFVTGIISMVKNKERAFLLYVVTTIGFLGSLFALGFVLGEILAPH